MIEIQIGEAMIKTAMDMAKATGDVMLVAEELELRGQKVNAALTRMSLKPEMLLEDVMADAGNVLIWLGETNTLKPRT